MVKLIQQGKYTLIETKGHTRMLMLDKKVSYAWIHVGEIGEILVTSHKPHAADHILATGKYRMYEVKDEPKLTDLTHLELLAGNGIWQGYLLTSGLPNSHNKDTLFSRKLKSKQSLISRKLEIKKRTRIIPTKEVITKSTA